MDRIDIRRLVAFVAVVEAGKITDAAERLGMAQPPLTRLLRGLERELDAPLLRRLPRGVAPTEAGQALFEEAKAVLARADRVADTVRRAARGEQGRLAVGFTSSAALHPFVPDALRRFGAALPGVHLELDEAGTMELIAALTGGRLDAAFVRSPVARMEGVLVDPVLDEPMVVALPSDHALSRAADPLKLAALAREKFVLYRRLAGPGLYDAIVAACATAGFLPAIAQEAPRLPATLSLVAAGIGLSLVPASMGRLAMPGVAFRALDAPGLSAPLHLALRRSGRSAVAARFRELVRTLAAGV